MQKRKENMLERVKQVAAEKKGKCLSVKYVKQTQKLIFECKNGHVWEAIAKSILSGTWCRKCFNQKMADERRIGIETARELARARGGECLSDVYERSGAPLKWKCDKGHEWETTYSNIRVGNWCRKCFNESLKHDINTLHHWAESKGGKLISTEYTGIHEHVKWQCALGHEWTASFGNVYHQNTWCPICSLKYETYCRRVFEHLFGLKFDKHRPSWLINTKTNNRLELDGFNEYESLAFEYDGKQHDKYVPFFHKTEDRFIAQQERDKIKKELCAANDITLINIPHTCNNKQTIDEHIINSLNNIGYEFTIDDVKNTAY